MKKTLVLSALGILALLVFACGPGERENPGVTIISGTLKNTNGEWIRLINLKSDSLKFLDSVRFDDEGRFEFSFRQEKCGFYMLSIAKDNYITLLLNPGETAGITGNSRELARDYRVTGSTGSVLLWELNRVTRTNYRRADSLYEMMLSYRDSSDYFDVKMEIDSMYQRIFERQQDFNREFVQTNASSPAAVFALYQVFGRQKVLGEKEDYAYFRLVDSMLYPNYKGHDFADDLHLRVEAINKSLAERKKAEMALDSGLIAPDIVLNQVSGKKIKLSELRGRYVLIFFWSASGTGSMNAAAELRWLYKTYRPKGFEILGISLDTYRQTWEDAIRQYKMNWLQAGDLLGWESPVVRVYALDHIPAYVLVDPQGRIMGRSMDTRRLAEMLSRIFR